MKTRCAAAGALVVLALTACGSTVQTTGLSSPGAATVGDSLGTPVADGASSDPAGTPAGESTTTGSTDTTVPGATRPTSTAVTAPPTGGARGSAGRPAATGAGPAAPATKSPVEVGVVIFPDVNAAAAKFGGSADVGDQEEEARTAISWVNTHGGLNGHRVVPVFFKVQLTSAQTYAQTYQQICSAFTEDHHVVATMLVGNAEAGLPACLAKGRSLLIAHGHYLHDPSDFVASPNLVTPEDAGSRRVAQAMVEQALAKGLLKRGDKLGLLVMDYNGPRRARDEVVVPLLKAQGVETVSFEVPYPQSTQDISNSAAAVQSAQLRMAADGIKTVAFLCPGCVSFFVSDAESQSYYPRYVMSSYDTMLGYAGKGHTRSFAGSVTVGFDPIRDVGTYRDGSPLAGNETYALCRSIEKTHISDDTKNFAAVAFCGEALDLYAAARANPVEPLSASSLLAGFDRLGSTHDGAANLATELGPQRRDGVAAYRTLRYDPSADRFAYDGGPVRPLP